MSYPGVILATSGLVSFWKGGELVGPGAGDAVGVNPGTYVAAPSLGAPSRIADYGDVGTSVVYNATSQYVTVPDSASLDVADQFTVEGVLSRANTSAAFQPIFFKGVGCPQVALNNSKIQVQKWASGLAATAGIVCQASITIPDSGATAPHHFAVTKDGTSLGTKIYIDGVNVSSAVAAATFTSNATDLWWFSGKAGASDVQFWGGYVAQYLALYNRALSAAEVTAHYAAGFTYPPRPTRHDITTVFFPESSYWNQPVALSENLEVDPDSGRLVGELLRQVNAYGATVNTTQFTIPVYTVDADGWADDEVVIDNPGLAAAIQSRFMSVPLHPDLGPDPSSDGTCAVYDPATDRAWEYFQLGLTIFPPTGLNAAASQSGGTLPAATYFYNVSCWNAAGETITKERNAVITSSAGKVTVTWDVNSAAAGYNVYRGTVSGTGHLLATIAGSGTHSFVDDGTVSLGGQSLPTDNTALHDDGKWHCTNCADISSLSNFRDSYYQAPRNMGESASSLPAVGGLVTLYEVQTLGRIRHALAVELKDIADNTAAPPKNCAWPAQRGDGVYTSQPAIRYGQMFMLDPCFDVEGWNFNSTSTLPKMLARALQRYGAYVHERGSAVAVYAENSTSIRARNPWLAVFNGDSATTFMNSTHFPWHKMIAVRPKQAGYDFSPGALGKGYVRGGSGPQPSASPPVHGMPRMPELTKLARP